MTEQQKFEAALSCKEDWGHRSFKKRKDGRYEKWSVQLAWDAWQARASQDRSAEWQPIETAPKYCAFLGYQPLYNDLWLVAPMYWSGSAFLLLQFHTDNTEHEAHPTHWMPLPPPPKGQE